MFNRLIHHFLGRRHFWRTADFTELAELYASRMLRSMAVGMVGVFVGIYLLRSGYSLSYVLGYFTLYFAYRTLCVWPSALLVGRIGPKHAGIIANLTYVPGLVALATIPTLHVNALVLYLFFQGFSMSLYNVAFYVNLSKVKHVEHAGKEMGFILIVTRIGTALSPLVGGISATLLGAQFTFLATAVIFFIAGLPSLFTPEPVATHQRVTLKGLALGSVWHNLVAQFGVGVDFIASGQLWSLFIAVVVLAGSGNSVYAKIGALSSITLIAALLSARAFGSIVDRKQGRRLLLWGVAANSLIHAFRPFVSSVSGVAATNLANEVASTAYVLPFTKGECDAADSLPGHRIAYIGLMEIAGGLGATVLMAVAFASVNVAGDGNGLRWSYGVAAILAGLIAWNGFAVFLRGRQA